MNKLINGFFAAILLLGMTASSLGEEPAMRDRQDEIKNEELRRAVAGDREAAKLAHEQEMLAQREADAKRLADMDKSKERYKDVITEREANEKRSPQEKEQVRQQRAESSKKNEKTKIK